ncbi:hypothetical protein [Sulfurimonas sp.]
MEIETRYNYEKVWSLTQEKDLLKIIEEELSGVGSEGTLKYIKETLQKNKEITVGSCKFRKKGA